MHGGKVPHGNALSSFRAPHGNALSDSRQAPGCRERRHQPGWQGGPRPTPGCRKRRHQPGWQGGPAPAPVCERRHTHGGAGAARIHEQLNWNRPPLFFVFFFCFFLLIYVLCFVVALCWGPPPVVNNQRCLCTHLWDVQRDEIALAKNGSRTKRSTPNLLAFLINSKVFKPTKSLLLFS